MAGRGAAKCSVVGRGAAKCSMTGVVSPAAA